MESAKETHTPAIVSSSCLTISRARSPFISLTYQFFLLYAIRFKESLSSERADDCPVHSNFSCFEYEVRFRQHAKRLPHLRGIVGNIILHNTSLTMFEYWVDRWEGALSEKLDKRPHAEIAEVVAKASASQGHRSDSFNCSALRFTDGERGPLRVAENRCNVYTGR